MVHQIENLGAELQKRESGSNPFMGDGGQLPCWVRLHSLFQANSSNNAFASCKSFVSNPSVNQP
jgi:hypothetical protein